MPTPHDALFKRVFSQPENAAAELRCVLPEMVARHIDWQTLEPQPGSFVDHQLRGRHADLLYSVRLARRRAFVYVLLEHKSEPNSLTAFQLLVYAVRIWQRFREENPRARRLPPIVSVVVHHSEGGWSGGTELLNVLDLDPAMASDVGPYVPNLRFVLDDLAKESEDALHHRTMSSLGRLALFCLKRARVSGDLLGELRGWVGAMRNVAEARDGADALASVLWYIMRVQGVAPETMRRFLDVEVGPTTEKAMKTTADWIAEEALQDMLLEQLKTRFGDLPDDVVERVRAAGRTQLTEWAKSLMDADSLEQVFAE